MAEEEEPKKKSGIVTIVIFVVAAFDVDAPAPKNDELDVRLLVRLRSSHACLSGNL